MKQLVYISFLLLFFMGACKKNDSFTVPPSPTTKTFAESDWESVLQQSGLESFNSLVKLDDNRLLLNCEEVKKTSRNVVNLLSSDDGKSWSPSPDMNFSTGWLQFQKLANGYVVAASTLGSAGLFISKDNSNSWQAILRPSAQGESFGFRFNNSSNASIIDNDIYIGRESGFFVSKDFGATWTRLYNSPVFDNHFARKDVLIITDRNAHTFSSYNAGQSWREDLVTENNEPVMFRSYLEVGNAILAQTLKHGLFKTEDRGRFWQKVSGFPLDKPSIIKQIGKYIMVADGSKNQCVISEDKGKTWVQQTMPPSSSANKVSLITDLVEIKGFCYLLTDEGVFRKKIY